MKYLGCSFLLLSAAVAIAGDQAAKPATGLKVDPFTIREVRGAERSLGDFADKKVVVLAFLGCDCPLAKLYAPRLASMSREFEKKGVVFLAVNSNQQDSPSDIARYAKDSGIEFPILKDVNNVLADKLGVQRTPEMLVLDGDRVVRYRGRVDDQYNIGIARAKATQNYLRDAIEELLAGKNVSKPNVPAIGCLIGKVHKPAESGKVTYTKHIASILNNRCVECHRAGQIGPFSLTSYEETVGWADMIDEVVQQSRMPPWHADPKYGHFRNEARLSDAEKKLISDWAHDGAPRGDTSDMPPTPTFSEGWRIPKPDVVLTVSRPFKVPATGTVPYQWFVIDPGFTEDKWITAAEIRSTCRAVVHHVLVFVQPPDAPMPARGKGGFISNWLAATVPGARPMILPDGLAKRVPAGSRLLLQMHYTADGREEIEQSSLGLVFADPGKVRKEVHTDLVLQQRFRIPPHEAHYKVEATRTLEEDTELWTLMPHLHTRGVGFSYEAIYPDGKKEMLLDVPHFDFNWQNSYELAEPKVLPKGTQLHCVAYFDNSSANLANPNPNQAVTWGEQTWEEMMIGYFDRTSASEDRLPHPPAAVAKRQAKPLPGLEPELVTLARSAVESQAAFDAFAKAVHAKLPQVDRVCLTSVAGAKTRVVRSAYPGKEIPHVAETGFEQVSMAFQVTIYALFNQFVSLPDLSKERGYDMQVLSKTLKSSVHVPIACEALPSTLNVWSSQAKAFSPEEQLLLKALALEVAKHK